MTAPDNKQPQNILSPREALEQHEILRSMRENEPDLDEQLKLAYRELEAGLRDQVEAIAAANPDLLKKIDPIAVRFASLFHEYQNVKKGKAYDPLNFDYVPESLTDANYKDGTVYAQLSEAEQERMNEVYASLIQMLNPEVIEEISDEFHTPEEAAENLGLKVEDVERSFGMLQSIEDNITDGTLEFRTFDFNHPKTDGPDRTPGTEGLPTVGPSGKQEDKYLGRIRYAQDGLIMSVVLDVVPPVKGNAAYAIRGDDGRLERMDEIVTSKISLRANGSRKIHHMEPTGEAGVVKRINKALTMPFEQFLDKENYPLS